MLPPVCSSEHYKDKELCSCALCPPPGGQSGPSWLRLRCVGAAGRAGGLPLHVGHPRQHQQRSPLQEPLPLRPALPAAGRWRRGAGAREHGPRRAGEAQVWPLHQRSLGDLLHILCSVEKYQTKEKLCMCPSGYRGVSFVLHPRLF